MTINEKPVISCGGIAITKPVTFDFENKTLDDLKKLRKSFDLKEVHPASTDLAYMVKMIDILLEKVERLENDNQ